MPRAMENFLQRHRPKDRIREHSSEVVNRRIDQVTQNETSTSIRDGRDGVIKRVVELEHEWDIDRALMLNFAMVGGLAFGLGLWRYAKGPLLGPRRKGLFYLLGTQLGFLALHAVAGWCPPAVLFRRLGFRSRPEIETERLQLLRSLDNKS